MYLCSHGHEEICFEGRQCPLCDVLSEVKILTTMNEAMELEINNLKSILEDA